MLLIAFDKTFDFDGPQASHKYEEKEPKNSIENLVYKLW